MLQDAKGLRGETHNGCQEVEEEDAAPSSAMVRRSLENLQNVLK